MKNMSRKALYLRLKQSVRYLDIFPETSKNRILSPVMIEHLKDIDLRMAKSLHKYFDSGLSKDIIETLKLLGSLLKFEAEVIEEEEKLKKKNEEQKQTEEDRLFYTWMMTPICSVLLVCLVFGLTLICLFLLILLCMSLVLH